MKKYVMSALMGMGFGFPITLLCMTLIGGYNEVLREFFIWMAASALYGLLSVFMDSKRFDMPMPVSLGLHFFGIVGITLGAALLCGYVSGVGSILAILIPTVAIYLVVCGISFWLMKKDEKQINKALEEK